MAQIAVLMLMTLALLSVVIVATNILAAMRRARIRQNIPQQPAIAFPQRFKDRVIVEERPIEREVQPLSPSPMRRDDLPPGQMMSDEVIIHVEPDETGPYRVSAFRRYVDKDGTTRRDVRRIIDRLEDVKKAG